MGAITCPDGSTLPDEQADQCPDANGVSPGATTELDSVDFNFNEGEYQCGTGEDAVQTGVNLGCKGAEIEASGGQMNPVIDMLFALFRFLSAGVGLVIIGSIIVAGIQYTTSRGAPQATEAAIKRVTNSVIALLFYLLIFAIANYLVPGGMFV